MPTATQASATIGGLLARGRRAGAGADVGGRGAFVREAAFLGQFRVGHELLRRSTGRISRLAMRPITRKPTRMYIVWL